MMTTLTTPNTPIHAEKALIAIDLQNDYFPEGKYPLWNTEQVLANTKQAITKAQQQGMAIILVQHIANPQVGAAPFFNQGTEGAKIHPEILECAPEAWVVEKAFADSFEQTELNGVLQQLGCKELVLCGMMTQNCVTHTALSKAAEPYRVSILADTTTTVDAMIHNIALHAMSTRVALIDLDSEY